MRISGSNFFRQEAREGKALPKENKPETIMKMVIGLSAVCST